MHWELGVLVRLESSWNRVEIKGDGDRKRTVNLTSREGKGKTLIAQIPNKLRYAELINQKKRKGI